MGGKERWGSLCSMKRCRTGDTNLMNRPALLPEAMVMSYPCYHQGPFWDPALPQLGSVLISVPCVATKSYVDVHGLGYSLKSC